VLIQPCCFWCTLCLLLLSDAIICIVFISLQRRSLSVVRSCISCCQPSAAISLLTHVPEVLTFHACTCIQYVGCEARRCGRLHCIAIAWCNLCSVQLKTLLQRRNTVTLFVHRFVLSYCAFACLVTCLTKQLKGVCPLHASVRFHGPFHCHFQLCSRRLAASG
jgi:hypothetical protein